GGAETGVVGFAMGIDRVIRIKESTGEPFSSKRNSGVFLVTLGEEAYKKGVEILWMLRRKGISSDIDYEERSLKAQMRAADKYGARFAAILGEDELRQNVITLKDMQSGEQLQISMDSLAEKVAAKLSL
ncbi:MAG: histidine--tRNA ligase, partial [Candidatus Omnitrophica bacterium]|nr:histidine--tRNA ligase [Candidatus Omnitrophota bacterium]